jgi:hypothetical protein
MLKPSLVAFATLLLSGGLIAQETSDSFYRLQPFGSVEFGGAVINDLDGRLDGPGGLAGSVDDLEVSFDPGLVAYGGFREEVRPWLAAEVLSGFIYNGIDEIRGPGFFWVPDANLMQVPIMFNLVFQAPLEGGLTPYAGAGIGALISWLDIDDQVPTGVGTTVSVDESSTEVGLAYQAFAGIRLAVGGSGQLSLGYRYLGGEDPGWSLKAAETGNSAGTLRVNNLAIHSLTIGFHIGL